MYNSKYYTCEQIDQRLLEGYYDDAVAAGYTGSKSQYLAGLLQAINYSANPTITADKVAYNSASGLYKNVQEALGEIARQTSKIKGTITQSNDLDSKKENSDIGLWFVNRKPDPGIVLVCYDFENHYVQVKLSATRNVSVNETTNKPSIQYRKYIDNAWTEWAEIEFNILKTHILQADGIAIRDTPLNDYIKSIINPELAGKFDKASIVQEFGDSEGLVMSQKATTEIVRGIKDDIEQHFFNYDENFRNITSKIKLSKRYTNYLIGYYNTKNSQYELYRYTRTELSDVYWNNNAYWHIIPCKSFELFVQMYKDIYYNQAFNCNNLRRIQEDEAMNLLDTSISLGIAINYNGVIQKGEKSIVEIGADHVVQGPIYVKQLDNVVIYSEDRYVPNNKPDIYKYDEVGNFISSIHVTTFPFIVDVSDCTYIFVRSYRVTNLQVVPGTTPFPASSKLWAFRSLYSEGVILPYNLYYLDNLLLPYYVENISINKGVELYGSFGLNIINREELFIPKGEGVININIGYGYRDVGTIMQTQVKKARLSTANKSPKILCIGDSFTEMGTWQITLKDNLENLGINAEFIGAMHSVNTALNKVGISENQTGGRLRANFIDAVAGKCYLVKVSGLSEKTMPINFNRYVTYTSNGYTWTVWGYNLSEEGDGTMRLYCTDAAASLSETGVLTKKSGTGDASINYTNATEVNKNPFYNPSEQKFDPQYYLSAWGFDKPDVVCLMFGANDMVRSSFNKTFWKDVKDFIDAWKNVLPDTKFVIGSSKLYMPYANNWGAPDKRSLKYNFAYLSLLYKDSEDIYICPTWANIDPKNGFDVMETVASKRFPDVKFKTNSNVHPNVGGMQQIGDAMTPYVIDALN